MSKKKVQYTTEKKEDLPAMPFYVGDWFKCPEVRALSPDLRGLWFDLICFMWQSPQKGIMLKPNGSPYCEAEIVNMVGRDYLGGDKWLQTLLENGVCRKREDGAIYSRFMMRQEEARQMSKNNGLKGGNPALMIDN
jgi:hypothetical protein